MHIRNKNQITHSKVIFDQKWMAFDSSGSWVEQQYGGQVFDGMSASFEESVHSGVSLSVEESERDKESVKVSQVQSIISFNGNDSIKAQSQKYQNEAEGSQSFFS